MYMLIHRMHFTVFVRIKEIVKSITNEHYSFLTLYSLLWCNRKVAKICMFIEIGMWKKNKKGGKDRYKTYECAAIFSGVDDTYMPRFRSIGKTQVANKFSFSFTLCYLCVCIIVFHLQLSLTRTNWVFIYTIPTYLSAKCLN